MFGGHSLTLIILKHVGYNPVNTLEVQICLFIMTSFVFKCCLWPPVPLQKLLFPPQQTRLKSYQKSYQAIYFLRIEDPEVIPGNILSQDRGLKSYQA